jgi:hypothetical protein
MPHMRRTLVAALAALATLVLVGLAAGPARAAASRTAGCGTSYGQYTGAEFAGEEHGMVGGPYLVDTWFDSSPPGQVQTQLAGDYGTGQASVLAGGGIDWWVDAGSIYTWTPIVHFTFHTTAVACRNGAVNHLSGTYTYYVAASGTGGSRTFDIFR